MAIWLKIVMVLIGLIATWLKIWPNGQISEHCLICSSWFSGHMVDRCNVSYCFNNSLIRQFDVCFWSDAHLAENDHSLVCVMAIWIKKMSFFLLI
jgi:hypothetical protein